MDTIIELKNVVKEYKILERHEGLKGSFLDLFSRKYKIIKAVKDISFNINRGEIVGYLGPNGSGKSTTIKMMTGVLEPTNGKIVVDGLIPYKNRMQFARNIGVVFGQRTQLWWALPLIESFKMLKKIYKIDDAKYNEQIKLYESILDIKSLYSKPVCEMSLGQRILCDILAAFLHNPSIIFLDEPTIGLDVAIKSKIHELIKKLNNIRKTTVLLTTHDIGDVEALCQRVIIIDKGSLLYDDSYDKLRKYFGNYKVIKLKLNDDSETDLITEKVNSEFELNSSKTNNWISWVVNEDSTPIINVLQFLQKNAKIKDIGINDIDTETIIKKFYEGNAV